MGDNGFGLGLCEDQSRILRVNCSAVLGGDMFLMGRQGDEELSLGHLWKMSAWYKGV